MSQSKVTKSLLDHNNVQVLPGDCILQSKEDVISSSGTYIRNGYIFASIVGFVQIVETTETDPLADKMDNEDNGDKSIDNCIISKKIVTVVRPDAKKVPYLEPGSIVTCRVLRIGNMFAKCSIHCVEDYILKQPFSGILRTEDICSNERDRVNINKCFRPGDIILAKVLAGENHLFRLTTASVDLGVVIATNEWNEPMLPITLNEVLCQRTFTKEPRKVAKIDMIS